MGAVGGGFGVATGDCRAPLCWRKFPVAAPSSPGQSPPQLPPCRAGAESGAGWVRRSAEEGERWGGRVSGDQPLAPLSSAGRLRRLPERAGGSSLWPWPPPIPGGSTSCSSCCSSQVRVQPGAATPGVERAARHAALGPGPAGSSPRSAAEPWLCCLPVLGCLHPISAPQTSRGSE